MKKLLALLMFPAMAFGQVGVIVPGNNSQSYNYDEIRTSGGTTCRQAIGSNLNVEFGAIGSDRDLDSTYQNNNFNDFQSGDSGTGVYGKITYALGAPDRLNCDSLYQMELNTLRRELEMLRADPYAAE